MKAASFIFLFSLACVGFASEEKPAPAGITYYNFLELIRKADRILVGEIGEKKDGAVLVKALETLKGPARDPKKITPDAIKRAEELLAGGKSSIPPADAAAAENLDIAVVPPAENMLPRAGTQVIFFLWDAEKPEDGKPPTFRINHPQCIYEANVLPQVRVALQKPRSVADGRYLRDRDGQLAERAAQRKIDEELKRNAGGEMVTGMQIEAARPKLMLKADNSFQISSRLLNRFTKEVGIYSGPAFAYGVIICKKDAPPESAIVLRLNSFDAVDPLVLNITSLTDFDSIAGENSFTQDHKFDAVKYPILKTLDGEYRLKTFYTNNRTGVKDGLTSPAWTGTVVSKEIPFQFKKPAD